MCAVKSLTGLESKRPQTKALFKLCHSQLPIRKFDRSDFNRLECSDIDQSCKAVERSSSNDTLPQQVPLHLLMVSILELVCQNYIHDPVKAELLFKVICEELSKLHIISPLSFIDEIKSLRQQHLNLFHEILKKAVQEINKNDQALTLPPTSSIGLMDEVMHSQKSRYRADFKELRRLGEGGYGSVYEAKNYLDSRLYAVKKIRFQQKISMESMLRLLREVKALAKLKHKHIVGYNASWMEYVVASDDVVNKESYSDDNIAYLKSGNGNCVWRESSRGDDFSHKNTDDSLRFGLAVGAKKLAKAQIADLGDFDARLSDSVVFERSGLWQTYSFPSSRVEGHSYECHTRSSVHRNTDDCARRKGDGENREVIECLPLQRFSRLHTRHYPSQHFPMSCFNDHHWRNDCLCYNKFTLYIQMELCSTTLCHWMKERNSKMRSDHELVNMHDGIMNIFLQIVKGVDYIHSHQMIHRDLKPKNIFLQGDTQLVKIGDFGLAKDYIMNLDTVILSKYYNQDTDHTVGVGTSTYAAPEQMRDGVYDSKCDMYSLGIILYELCQWYQTDMERLKSIRSLRLGSMAPSFELQWPHQRAAVVSLTQSTPSFRPSSSNLLSSQMFLSPHQVILTLQDTLAAKEDENKSLKEQVLCMKTELQDTKMLLHQRNEEVASLRTHYVDSAVNT